MVFSATLFLFCWFLALYQKEKSKNGPGMCDTHLFPVNYCKQQSKCHTSSTAFFSDISNVLPYAAPVAFPQWNCCIVFGGFVFLGGNTAMNLGKDNEACRLQLKLCGVGCCWSCISVCVCVCVHLTAVLFSMDYACVTPSRYWPCVLRTAAFCSFYTAAGRRTLLCSSHWSGQQRSLPAGGEPGPGTCNAPGGQMKRRMRREINSLFDLFLLLLIVKSAPC